MADRKHQSSKKSKKCEDSNEEQTASVTKFKTLNTYQRSVGCSTNPRACPDIGFLNPHQETPDTSVSKSLETTLLLPTKEAPSVSLEAAPPIASPGVLHPTAILGGAHGPSSRSTPHDLLIRTHVSGPVHSPSKPETSGLFVRSEPLRSYADEKLSHSPSRRDAAPSTPRQSANFSPSRSEPAGWSVCSKPSHSPPRSNPDIRPDRRHPALLSSRLESAFLAPSLEPAPSSSREEPDLSSSVEHVSLLEGLENLEPSAILGYPSHPRVAVPSHKQVANPSNPRVADPSHQQELSRLYAILTSLLTDPSHPRVADPSHQQELSRSHPILRNLLTKPRHQQVANPSHQQLTVPSHKQVANPSHTRVAGTSHQQELSRSHPNWKFSIPLYSRNPTLKHTTRNPTHTPLTVEPGPLPGDSVNIVRKDSDTQNPCVILGYFSKKYYRESILESFFPFPDTSIQGKETQSKSCPPFLHLWFNNLSPGAQNAFLRYPIESQLQLPSLPKNILQNIFSLPKEEMKIAFTKPCEFLKQYYNLSKSMRIQLPMCSLNDFQELYQWLCDQQHLYHTWPSTIRQLFGELYRSMLEYISPSVIVSKVNVEEQFSAFITTLNIAVLGSPRCGKTSYILRLPGITSFVKFNPTIFESKVHIRENYYKKLRLIDVDMTNYFEIYDSVKNGHYALLCYAVNDLDSLLQAMGKWYNVVREISSKIPIFLIGLKCDQRCDQTDQLLDGRPAVPLKLVEKVCHLFKIAIQFECSSFTRENIEDSFRGMLNWID